ncbi:UNVERIFIED_CONTAM: CCR4-NOT transcription complex subunit [Sesamum calycinum]|uniref:CCR4-NOT transcription complex subunit n=1 Tax=Sesamum calycinum TaxID=2727403 RepID=A0AAW2Q348_9LAMI
MAYDVLGASLVPRMALGFAMAVERSPYAELTFLYLYPFLNTTSKSRPFEYLRLTSLGVIGALVKVDDTEVISFLLSTEIIPLCLRTMEMGSELSKTVATFIVQKILLDDVGLEYICTTAERFFAVGRVLGNMVAALAEQPSSRLLKHIIRCYLRLSDNPRACDALRSCLPDMLRDATFSSCLREDPTTRRCLQQLVHNVARPRVAMQAGAGFDHYDGQLNGYNTQGIENRHIVPESAALCDEYIVVCFPLYIHIEGQLLMLSGIRSNQLRS